MRQLAIPFWPSLYVTQKNMSITIEEDLNDRLRKTLEKYKCIESPFIGLFASQDIFLRPPYFPFRFKDGHINDYLLIKKIIDNFNGHVLWTMSSKPTISKNWVIEPLEFKEFRDINNNCERDNFESKFGKRYYEICEKAMNDVKDLCYVISNELNLQ